MVSQVASMFFVLTPLSRYRNVSLMADLGGPSWFESESKIHLKAQTSGGSSSCTPFQVPDQISLTLGPNAKHRLVNTR